MQKYLAPAPAIALLSVLRTTLDGDRWADQITWDELQQVKNEQNNIVTVDKALYQRGITNSAEGAERNFSMLSRAR